MPSRFQLAQAVNTLHSEGVIAYPTESVYGLGCNPLSEHAVNKILLLKNRPVEKGLILIASNIYQLKPYIDISKSEQQKIESYPSAKTWLVHKTPLTPFWISGTHEKVAIRVSQHPTVRELCDAYSGAITSTSANPAGAQPANTALKAQQYFSDEIDYYLHGETGDIKQATPIEDIETGKLIRL